MFEDLLRNIFERSVPRRMVRAQLGNEQCRRDATEYQQKNGTDDKSTQ